MRGVDRQEFLKRADECLRRVETWLGRLDENEVDFSTSDGLVTIEFPDDARFVLNRQTAANQMWLAAGARAWHYRWDPARATWADDRDAHELWTRLAEVVGGKVGHSVAAP